MKAGFSRRCVNPPLGSPIQGLGQRGGCKSIREDIYVQALHLSHSDEEAVIVGADLLFFDRPVIDRIKETAGRRIGICPERIFFNVTHNHAGPPVGTWGYGHIPDPGYLDLVEEAIAGAVGQAKQARRDVTISGGMTRCRLPVSRRNLDDKSQAQWLPDPDGPSRLCRPPQFARAGPDGYTPSGTPPPADTRRLTRPRKCWPP